MTGGLLLSQQWGRWRARFAVRVTGAVDLTRLVGYADLPVGHRYDRAHREDAGYLARLSGNDPACAFEARWSASDDGAYLTLLGRVDRPSREEAETAGAAARSRLAAMPEHVVAQALTEEADVERAFMPFPVDPRGIAEVRRRCVVAAPRRPDSSARFYLTVSPFRSAPERWPDLLDRLTHAGAPVMVSTGIQPMRVPPGYGEMLMSVARQYGELARPATSSPGLAAGKVRLGGDPLAAEAEQRYQDAARRYSSWVFKLRVTVAAATPHTGDVARAVADVLGNDVTEVERPAAPEATALLMESISSLGVPRWGGHEVWRNPAVADSLRLLSELADATEAASAVWLPAAAIGPLPAVPAVDPEPHRRAGSGGIVISHSDVKVDGSIVGGNQHDMH